MKKMMLNGEWTLKNERIGSVSAVVPGCVHTDLIANGMIKDIFWRDNNLNYQWIEDCDWTYTKTFSAEAAEDAELVFEGLDTYAEVFLNGTSLGKTENMFISYRFAVGDVLRDGENTLEVRFFSPVRAVADKPALKGAFTTERLHTRRIQCTYSWDWVDRFVTCGIWRPVYLAYANGIDVESVYVHTDFIDDFGAQVCVEAEFGHLSCGGAMAHVELIDPDGAVAAKTSFYADQPKMIRYFDLPKPRLWYPVGYGDQPLYRVVVTVGENRFEDTFGIRTVRIVQLADREGDAYWELAKKGKQSTLGAKFEHNEDYSGFFVLVNGKRIYCRGGNWVPCEPFPSAETPEKIELLVGRAVEMGANFLRVWGGGIFENPAFYNACDRKGVLVIQDFLMACGHYPEKEEWFIRELQKEAAHAARMLRNHPCLAWWQGDNENAMKGSDLQEDYTGRSSALCGIGPMLMRHDPHRQFLPSSPYGGDTYASSGKGTTHNTNICGEMFSYFYHEDCADYKAFFESLLARFVSEEPAFGMACRSSLLRFMTEADLLEDPDEYAIYYHTQNNPALKRHFFGDVSSFARKVLGDFENGEDKFFKYKYIQYEWVRVVFEACRRHLGYNNGLVFWMHNDCWPAAGGWSFVDYYGLPKHSYYSFKRCAKDVVAVADTKDGYYRIVLSNIGERECEVDLHAVLLDLDGGKRIVAEHRARASVQAYATTELILPVAEQERGLLVCDATHEGGSDRCFYKQGSLPMHRDDAALRVISKNEHEIVLESDAYLHAVELEGRYVFSDNCFSMMAGERKTVRFTPYDNPNGEDFSIVAYTLA